MTTLDNRPNSALLVVDVQTAVVEGAYRRDEVVANIAALVGRARAKGVAVVWVQHSDADLIRGSDGWQIVPELSPNDGEPVIEKRYGDAFEDTDLQQVLTDSEVGRLVVVGAETDACVRSTLHGAFTRGYHVALVSDAHTAGDKTQWGAPPAEAVIAHTNLYWSHQAAPGRTTAVATTAEIDLE
ncbi:isochorismatase family protein [Mycolicibacterium austroafricanum]|uniref:isochorismatase family protein n=1 Tax=Mycolicibacterium austroafricanum TaxID=39687 RepID=UPI001CA34849|nr:isochorismatase family protein [Mycolicibacterium austroafricanum]QZT62015.1 isochorismatase family protein [Mycolicibacterium austroafricanum]